MFFIFDTRFYGSSNGDVNDYNELKKNVPNPTAQQIRCLITNFFMKKIQIKDIHKHNQRSSNIKKKTTFVRKLKILPAYLNKLKQDYSDYPDYFYEYLFPNGFDEWSKDNVFGPKKQIIGNFIKLGLT